MPARPMPPFDTGLREVGDGVYAYLQWDGGWGVSNAGFVEGDDGLLVIDSLLTPRMARDFIDAIRGVTSSPPRSLVLTHSHLDHVGGNGLFDQAEIVAHANCHAELEVAARQGPQRRPWMPDEWWEQLREVRPLLPTRTFDEVLELPSGAGSARLMFWGPAHTTGDTLVYLPESRVLFAGDIAFFYATPLCRGDMANWIRIIDRLEAELPIDLIIPGHGPPGGRGELDDQREYLDFLFTRTRACFEEGLSEEQAAAAIDLGQWARWPESERMAMNVTQIYRTFAEQPQG